MNATEAQINWERLAQPQLDQYDTKIILELAQKQGYSPKNYPDKPTWLESEVVLLKGEPSEEFAQCIPAPLDHPNLKKAWDLLSLYPAAFQQWQTLTESVGIFLDENQSNPRAISTTYSFGQTGTTINNELALAENLLKEMAHQKLWAIGIDRITNPPQQIYYSPIDCDSQQPMVRIFQEQYAYTHVAALDIAIAKEANNTAIAESLAVLLPKLEFGCKVIQDNAQLDDQGSEFLTGLFNWLEDLFREGYSLLDELSVELKPFRHPLLQPIYLSRPCKKDNLEENDLGEEMLIYSIEQETGFLLNKSSLTIWQLCDGQKNLEEIAVELDEQLGISSNIIIEDVRQAVERFEKLGILDLETP